MSFGRPTIAQGCLISLAGVALAFFGCLGAIMTSTGTGIEIASLGGMLMFGIGLLAVLAGVVIFINAVFKRLFGSHDTQVLPLREDADPHRHRDGDR